MLSSSPHVWKDGKWKYRRYYPAGDYEWIVPPDCEEVDVFLVGGGGGTYKTSNHEGGGGSGYTMTFRGSGYSLNNNAWEGTEKEGRNGNAIKVKKNQIIRIKVGKGTTTNGEYSEFLNSSYRALGGYGATSPHGADGGSGGGAHSNPTFGGNKGGDGGSDGNKGGDATESRQFKGGNGQGHTTRDFGEPWGKINAGGGAGRTSDRNDYDHYDNNKFLPTKGGFSDYLEGIGANESNRGGGGYGGGAGATTNGFSNRIGGDGTVLIRWKIKSSQYIKEFNHFLLPKSLIKAFLNWLYRE